MNDPYGRDFSQFKHQWKWDWPWHMVNLKDWFYMVSAGDIFGVCYLHVRILGIRSLWTFPKKYSHQPHIMCDCEECDKSWHRFWDNVNTAEADRA